MTERLIVDLFAGMGGWSEGLAALGRGDVGLELDAAACASRVAAGHLTIRASVADYPPAAFAGAEGIIASPPCQDFSAAGKRAGRTGERGRLIDLVPVWVEAILPDWVVCEQVPLCLEIWREHAHGYRELGYSTWVGILNSADYGVPQTRRRAILIASRTRPATAPEPTHARDPQPSLFGQLEPWVSMAEALGWGMDRRPSTTIMGGSNRGGGSAPTDGGSGTRRTIRRERSAGAWVPDTRVHPGARVGFARRDDTGRSPDGYRERDKRSIDEPAFNLTEKARSWTVSTGANTTKGDGLEPYERSVDEPAPTLDAKAGGAWRVEEGHRQVAPRVNTGRDWKAGGSREDAQEFASEDGPAPTLSAKSGGQWHLNPGRTESQPNRRTYDPEAEPAPVVAFGHDAAAWRWECPAEDGQLALEEAPASSPRLPGAMTTEPDWPWERPATVVCGDARSFAPGGHTAYDGRDNSKSIGRSENAIRITVEDALLLQGFRPDFPVTGGRSSQFLQVGNAIPPPLAAHVLNMVLEP